MDTAHRHSGRVLIIALVTLALIAVAGTWFFFARPRMAPLKLPAGMEASVLPRPKAVEPFTLTDGDGQRLDLARLKGHWSFVFFGYTHCPDVCPTTLAVLRGVHKKLLESPKYARGTQFIFISVDPKRDPPQVLKTYVNYFDHSFIGATGHKAQIDGLTRQMGAVYMFEGDTSGNDYIVNHSATIMLVDPRGRLVARLNTPHTVDGIVKAFRRIRDYYSD